MRAFSARFAIVVATVSAVAGCRSGGGSPWGFGRKSTDPTVTGHAEPQLPSANATSPGYGSSYTASTAPGSTSAFSEPAGAAPYPGQPTGYTGMPTTPGAMPGAAPANYAANTAVPQQGPYNENYGQPPAGSAQPYPTTGYPATSTPNGYQAGGQMGAAGAPPHAADPYVNAGPYAAADGGYGAPPADNAAPSGSPSNNGPYQADDPNASGGYRTADSRYGAADPYVAQPEQSAADRYGASSEPQTPNAPPASSTSREPYRPGSTGYHPGQTGYSPPGVPTYQVPAPPNVVSTPRTDPYYRPGGTSDYAPTTGATTPSARTPSASTDRYNTPPIGYGQANPYAQ